MQRITITILTIAATVLVAAPAASASPKLTDKAAIAAARDTARDTTIAESLFRENAAVTSATGDVFAGKGVYCVRQTRRRVDCAAIFVGYDATGSLADTVLARIKVRKRTHSLSTYVFVVR